MSRADRRPASASTVGQGGFVLAEVVVASVILALGVAAAGGLVRLAAYEMRLSARAEAARWEVAAMADSVLSGAAGGSGEREASWGVLRWGPAGPGVLVEGLRPEVPEGTPLARLWVATYGGDPVGAGGP